MSAHPPSDPVTLSSSPPSEPSRPRPPGARKKSRHDRARDPSGAGRPIRHGYFKSFDGTKLFYSIEGQGKPLIFCYGLVCSSLHWTYQIEHFAQTHQVIWFDYRGHQNSEIPTDLNSLTIENLARDLGLLMDELGLSQAVVLGHSMGVNVALEIYHQRPERIAGLVLANGTAVRPLETLFGFNALQSLFTGLRRAYAATPKLLNRLWKLSRGNPLARALVTLGGFNPHLTPREDIALYVDQVADMDPAILLYLIQDYERYDATAWLHQIRVPTLVVAGERDRVTPPGRQELMQQLIPQSELCVVRHGSHCPQMDLPELVNLRIETFLKKIDY